MDRLKGRVAIITGAASGIGKATAIRFAREGASVALWDVNREGGEAVTQMINSQGGTAHFWHVNTTDESLVMAAAAEVNTRFARIDILVNNAGITRDATLKKMERSQWDQVIGVNLTGVFLCAQAIVPYMEANEYGRIINASSIVGLTGNFGQTNYAATKSGVIGMTKVWARELGRKGITANAIAPGFIRTEMMETIPEKVLETFTSRTPLQRLGTVEELASAYLFLASEEASFINGAVLSVDGGLSL
ncbi:MAG: 3-oxoacyl-ACP reductase FabG [Saprospiraceae bacterium]|nr:3-oxoacyl-ACP reductase FabG [Saprospiraceae bacterium]